MKNIKTTNKNILYILGAGASAGALPVVDQMVDRMNIFFLHVLILKDKDEYKFYNLGKWHKFILELEKRRSFDTYAKEIYLQIDNSSETDDDGFRLEYIELKELLKAYLKWEESEFSIDKKNRNSMIVYRDDRTNFATDLSILSNLYKDYKKKNNIKEVLESWSSSFYKGIRKDVKIGSLLEWAMIKSGITELFRFEIDEDNPEKIYFVNDKNNLDQRYVNFLVDILDGDLDKIRICSWNYDTQLEKAFDNLNFKIDIKSEKRSKVLNNEIKVNGSIKEGGIRFAWDDDKIKNEENLNGFDRSVSDLIIIGYSFPFSNRKTDLSLFKEKLMLHERKIKLNISIQVPSQESYVDIKERLESYLTELNYNNYEIKHISDKNSFFIPPHY